MFLARCACNPSTPIFPPAEATDSQLHAVTLRFCLGVFAQGTAGPAICGYVPTRAIPPELMGLWHVRSGSGGDTVVACHRSVLPRIPHVHADGDAAKQRPIVCHRARAALHPRGGEAIAPNCLPTQRLLLLNCCRRVGFPPR